MFSLLLKIRKIFNSNSNVKVKLIIRTILDVFELIQSGILSLLYNQEREFFNSRLKLFINYLRGNETTIITLKKDQYIIPSKPHVIDIFSEMYKYKIYEGLEGAENMLDIGGFVGESACFLAKFNKKVTVFEAAADNYAFLLLNCKGKNIDYFNKAIISGDNEFLYLSSDYANHPNGMISDKPITNAKIQTKVECISISKLISENNYDQLKMDIEGAEFPIVEWFLSNEEKFHFKKGVIEFHIEDNEVNNSIFLEFIDLLKVKNYLIKFYSNKKKYYSLETIKIMIKNGDFFGVNLFFELTIQ